MGRDRTGGEELIVKPLTRQFCFSAKTTSILSPSSSSQGQICAPRGEDLSRCEIIGYMPLESCLPNNHHEPRTTTETYPIVSHQDLLSISASVAVGGPCALILKADPWGPESRRVSYRPLVKLDMCGGGEENHREGSVLRY